MHLRFLFFLTLGNIQLGQQSPLGQLILCDFYQLWSWVEISSSFSSEISLLALPKFEIIYSFLYGLDKQCVSPDHLILQFLLHSLNCNPFSAMSITWSINITYPIFISGTFHVFGCRDDRTRINVIVCINNVPQYITDCS